jgi:CRISPR type IV-associated protein Csf1
MLTLGELYGIATPGSACGRCVLCGRTTEQGHALDDVFSEKFTQYASLCAGDVVCEYCTTLAREPALRRSCWYMTRGAVTYVKRDELRAVLLSPPEPPFAIYATRGRRRQGWIALVHCVSYSQYTFYVGTDWTDSAVLVSLPELREYMQLAESLLEHKVARGALLGESPLHPAIVMRALREGWLDTLQRAQELVGNPVWEIAVFVAQTESTSDVAEPS